jgi:hypothetical protein
MYIFTLVNQAGFTSLEGLAILLLIVMIAVTEKGQLNDSKERSQLSALRWTRTRKEAMGRCYCEKCEVS